MNTPRPSSRIIELSPTPSMSNDYIHEHGDQADDPIVIPDDPGFQPRHPFMNINPRGWAAVMNRAVASEFPAPVPYLPMFPSISAILLVEIHLGYVLLEYSLWYFVIYFGNALYISTRR